LGARGEALGPPVCKPQAKLVPGRRIGRHVACITRLEGSDMPNPKTPPPTLEEFRARAATSGLPLTAEDIEHLHKGYVGLLKLMERIPSHWAWAAEPPHVFRADE